MTAVDFPPRGFRVFSQHMHHALIPLQGWYKDYTFSYLLSDNNKMDSSKSLRIVVWNFSVCVPVPYSLLVMGSSREKRIVHWLFINLRLLPPCLSIFKNRYEFWHYIVALMKSEKTFTINIKWVLKNFCCQVPKLAKGNTLWGASRALLPPDL